MTEPMGAGMLVPSWWALSLTVLWLLLGLTVLASLATRQSKRISVNLGTRAISWNGALTKSYIALMIAALINGFLGNVLPAPSWFSLAIVVFTFLGAGFVYRAIPPDQ